MADEFHPNSFDAMMSETRTVLKRVEKRLDEGDVEIKSLRQDVEALKSWRKYTIGLACGAGLLIRAAWEWLVNNGTDIHPKH